MQAEDRYQIPLSTFGFYEGGLLYVNVTAFSFEPRNTKQKFGFTLDKTISSGISFTQENHPDKCIFKQKNVIEPGISVIFFELNLDGNNKNW